MQDKLLQTPDGVRDTYDVECKKKRKVMHELHHILELYSYHDIETPTFEFSLKLECVCIGIACIAESDRKLLICIILCNTSRY